MLFSKSDNNIILYNSLGYDISIHRYLGGDHFGQVIKEKNGDAFNGYKDLHVHQMHTRYRWDTRYSTWNNKLVGKHTIIEQEVMASTHNRTNIYNISSLPFGLGGSSSRTYTKLSSLVTSVTFKRTMMVNCRMLQHVARSMYYCATTLSNEDLINNTTKKNKSALIKGLVELALDPQTGIPQQKTKIMRHMLPHRFDSTEVYNAYLNKIMHSLPKVDQILKNEPHILIDTRFMNELPTLQHYLKRYHSHIDWVLMTNDARPASFPNQHQTNQDFWVMVKTMLDPATGFGYKCVPQDEKSGNDMFHSCRGSLGLLTYEQNGTLVPFMNKDVDLATFNRERIINIQNVFNMKVTDYDLHLLLEKYKASFDSLTAKPTSNIFSIHNELQDVLFNQIQRNPLYSRSMSFIFTEHVTYNSFSNKQDNFANHFKSMLGNKTYNLDKQGDCQEIFKAMTIAYVTNVDPDFIKKIKYLHQEVDVKFNPHFLNQISKLIKDGLL